MRLFIIISVVSLLPFYASAQQDNENLWGSKRIRLGLSISATPSYWQQKSLNTVLRQNGLPETRSFSYTGAIGEMMQWDKLRVSLLLLASLNQNSNSGNLLQQRYGGLELNAEYFVIRNRKIALSPSLGGGFLSGNLKIRENQVTGDFPDIFVSRNTTELFNRLGYINVALNLGTDYSPRYRDHIFQYIVGYRFGFANSLWSANPKGKGLSGAPTDALRQVYLGLRMNFLFARKRS